MTTLEQVEKLRERANVSFEEAKEALEQSGGDILDALILLERQGKTTPPPSGGYYSGQASAEEHEEGGTHERPHHSASSGGDSFRAAMRGLGNLILKAINAGNTNHIDAGRNGKILLSCPVTVFVILLICAFWVMIPLIIISLFFGWRYRLRGPDLGKESINNVIASAEEAVEDLKNTVVESAHSTKEKYENKAAAGEETDGPEAL